MNKTTNKHVKVDLTTPFIVLFAWAFIFGAPLIYIGYKMEKAERAIAAAVHQPATSTPTAAH